MTGALRDFADGPDVTLARKALAELDAAEAALHAGQDIPAEAWAARYDALAAARVRAGSGLRIVLASITEELAEEEALDAGADGLGAEVAGAINAALDCGRRLAEVRAIFAAFDWETDDRQYALEAIERAVTPDGEL